MKVSRVVIRNFRRLENVQIDIEERESIFVGPNNSGKTSATAIFRCFLGGRDFKIHDFSVARMADFDAFVDTGDVGRLPRISLDMWFTIDPESIAFGRVFTLLPKLSDFARVGIRLSYEIEDAKKLREQYEAAYPAQEDGTRAKALSQYLSLDGNLGRHYAVCYFSLDEKSKDGDPPEIVTSELEPDEGKRLLKHLIRVEFVDAQRNINDDDSSRSNRLGLDRTRRRREALPSASNDRTAVGFCRSQPSLHWRICLVSRARCFRSWRAFPSQALPFDDLPVD